jgi:MFS family permease
MSNIIRQYPASFLVCYSIEYFNTGFRQILVLAYLYRFKNFYALSPSQVTQYTALLSLPWTPKLVYGFITDSFPIFGSRKKSYLILAGLLQFGSLVFISFPLNNVGLFVAMIWISEFCGALMDVVVDGLMVIQQRKDPNGGSEQLQAFSYSMYGIGGIVGSLLGGYLTDDGKELWCFAIRGFVGLLMAFAALFITK